MRGVWKGVGACLGTAVAIACSGASSSEKGFASGDGGSGSGSGGSGSSGGGSGSSSGSFLGDGGSSSGSNDGGSNCSGQAADYVYVLSAENDLYSFAPDKKLFKKNGPPG